MVRIDFVVFMYARTKVKVIIGAQIFTISNIPNDKVPGGSSTSQHLTIIIAGVSATAILLILGIVIAATVIACRKAPSKFRKISN